VNDIPYDNGPPASHYEYVIDNLALKQQAFDYMAQLHGWCAQEKAAVLIDLILKSKPEVILEIGVWGGKSLVPMACALRANHKGIIYGIDPWEAKASLQGLTNETNKGFWGWVDHVGVMQGLIDKIGQFELGEHIELIRSTSEEADPIYNIDILHIDGNHSDETSYIDVTKWVPLVKAGGLIIYDDITWSENGVTASQARAVAWLNEHCIKLAEFSDVCVWGIWLKP